MTLTDDDAIDLGRKAARNHLTLIFAAYGDRAAMAFAGGMVQAACDWISERHGRRCAYDLCAGLADEVIKPELAQ